MSEVTAEKQAKKHVRPHPAAAGPKTSGAVRGQAALSNDVVLNIAMNALNMVQGKFGNVEFVRAPGDEPAILVLPKTLDVCLVCGQIIPRTDVSYCKTHAPKIDLGHNVSSAPASVD